LLTVVFPGQNPFSQAFYGKIHFFQLAEVPAGLKKNANQPMIWGNH